MAKVILDEAAIARALDTMAESLCSRTADQPLALVGVRRGGEPLARRLAMLIAKRTGVEPPVGTVDITLYRDDGFGPHDYPQVGSSELGFDVAKHTVVLVDDVLYTGRTVRAAMDAILDYGRPKAMRLVVLVDRGLHELPVAADVVGRSLDTTRDEHISVVLSDSGEGDHVLLDTPAEAKERKAASGRRIPKGTN